MVPEEVDRDAVVAALFEEYRAVYGLALFRLGALDQRIPIAGGMLAAFVGGLVALPPSSQLLLLLGLPVALIWFMRATINHARSFEDALRRIEAIGREVNRLLGHEALSFQSRHPSGNREVGGRTGRETTLAVLAATLVLLAACGYQFWMTIDLGSTAAGAYFAYLSLVGLLAIIERLRLSQYLYAPRKGASN